MIDNSRIILEYILTDVEEIDPLNRAWLLQLIKRKKENPELKKNSVAIKQMWIHNSYELAQHWDYIKQKCNDENARAYICVNAVDISKLSIQYMKHLADIIANGQHDSIPNLYWSVAGKYCHNCDKRWVIDLDDEDVYKGGKIIEFIEEENYITTVPTNNGMHLITRPFRLDLFKKKFGGIDVHKRNATILYTP